jgi:hypothetical protein
VLHPLTSEGGEDSGLVTHIKAKGLVRPNHRDFHHRYPGQMRKYVLWLSISRGYTKYYMSVHHHIHLHMTSLNESTIRLDHFWGLVWSHGTVSLQVQWLTSLLKSRLEELLCSQLVSLDRVVFPEFKTKSISIKWGKWHETTRPQISDEMVLLHPKLTFTAFLYCIAHKNLAFLPLRYMNLLLLIGSNLRSSA